MNTSPQVEPLESRRLLSSGGAATPPDTTPPSIVATRLVGPLEAVTEMAITFSESLDPGTAADPANYRVSRKRFFFVAQRSAYYEKGLHSFSERPNVPVRSIAYDEATRSVIVSFGAPVNVTRAKVQHLRVVVEGGATGVRDTAGNPVPDVTRGGIRGTVTTVSGRRRLFYRDVDGDVVRLRLAGPGRIVVLFDNETAVVVSNGDAARSVLRGTVRVPRGRSGDGTAELDAVRGQVSPASPLLSDPAFRIVRTDRISA